jgi:hypothetical protein
MYLSTQFICHNSNILTNKVYQLFARGRWFSSGTTASSTTKTGRHDIAESDVKYQKSIDQINQPIVLH